MKHFDAPKRSVKIKNYKLIFILIQLSEIHGTGRVKIIKLLNLLNDLN